MSDEGISEVKAALRKEAFARRKTAYEEFAFAAATTRLLSRIGDTRGKIVAGYSPIRTEIDPIPAMKVLAGRRVPLCVPVIEGPGQPLIFREWTIRAKMVEGEFGAQVPAQGAWLEPDILIVPLVAFDRTGARLGYGGGYYDRTLSLLHAKKSIQAIGFAFAAQETPEVPTEPTDQRLDAIVTEAAIIECAR